MKKNKKRIIILVIVLVLIIGGISAFFLLKDKDTPEDNNKVVTTAGYYELKDNNTEYFKTLFNQLKQILNEEELDEEAYAKIIAQLYLADLFDLNSKTSSSDIGGLQFVYEPFRSDFTKLAKESIYATVENNIDGKRKQDLPVVHSVNVGEIKKESFVYNETSDPDAYYISMVITYEKSLGYQEDATLVLIHNDDRLEIAKMTK